MSLETQRKLLKFCDSSLSFFLHNFRPLQTVILSEKKKKIKLTTGLYRVGNVVVSVICLKIVYFSVLKVRVDLYNVLRTLEVVYSS